jgi:hypothetical protein
VREQKHFRKFVVYYLKNVGSINIHTKQTFKRNSKHILFGTQPHDSPRQYFSNCGLQWFARWSAAVSGEKKSTAKIVSGIE